MKRAKEEERGCFICVRSVDPKEWDYGSLVLMTGGGKQSWLCFTHNEWALNRIKELEENENGYQGFRPVSADNPRNWQDREPNDGSLIE